MDPILIVDDNDFVLECTATMLRRLGYDQVLCTTSALQACEMVQAAEYTPALVLTDFHMPEMNGDEMILRLREEIPHLKAIVMSGAQLPDGTSQIQLEEGLNFIAKPFTAAALLAVINKNLVPSRPPSRQADGGIPG